MLALNSVNNNNAEVSKWFNEDASNKVIKLLYLLYLFPWSNVSRKSIDLKLEQLCEQAAVTLEATIDSCPVDNKNRFPRTCGAQSICRLITTDTYLRQTT